MLAFQLLIYALAAVGAIALAVATYRLLTQKRREHSSDDFLSSVQLGEPKVLRGDEISKFFEGKLTLDHSVSIRIPEPLDPMERGRRFGDPIANALQKSNLGEVTGGGTMIGDSCALDITLTDFNAGIELLKQERRQLDAPIGTVIIYECGEIPIYET